MPAIIETDVHTATLRIELEFRPRPHRRGRRQVLRPEPELAPKRLRPKDLSELLDDMGWLGAVAQMVSVAENHHRGSPFQVMPKAQAIRGSEPDLLRMEFGSPFVSLIGIGPEVIKSAGGLAVLIVGLRFFWRIDLVFKTDRAEQRARFHEAQDRAARAEQRLEASRRRFARDDQEREEMEARDAAEREEWGAQLADDFWRRRRHGADWYGQAALHVDPDLPESRPPDPTGDR
jgi:hypothetical protein